jgi:hypothetical protein
MTGLLLWATGAALYAAESSWPYLLFIDLPLGGVSTIACCVYPRVCVDCLRSWWMRSEISWAMLGSMPGTSDGGTGGTE